MTRQQRIVYWHIKKELVINWKLYIKISVVIFLIILDVLFKLKGGE